MEFCLQYLTIKVCDYKLCDITFAVLKIKMTSTTNKRINKPKQRKGLWKEVLRRF